MRDSLQLRWWLNGFGEEVEVIEPEELRQEFAERAEVMRKTYWSRKRSR